MAIIKKWGLTYNTECIVGEHKCELPKELPKNRSDILFIDKDADNAYWQRITDYPNIFFGYVPYDATNLKATVRYQEGISDPKQDTKWNSKTNTVERLSNEDTKLIDNLARIEVERMTEGVFFRNGDEIEWLHPYHYTMLQWCKMKGVKENDGYGFFYKFQRNVFYLIRHAIFLKWCKGVFFPKAKKTGFTQQIGGGYFVGEAITNSEEVLGIMSTNEKVAIGTGYDSFLHAFKGLPLILKPMVSAMATQGGEMTLGDRSPNIVKKQDSNFLNTRIRCVATKPHAFDSYPYNIIWFDEFLKLYTDAKMQPRIILNDNISGIEDQTKIRGIAILSSYPPERNDIGSDQGRKIFYESKLSTIDPKHPEKGTTSKLICWHIPGTESMREYQDKYGNPMIKEASDLIYSKLEEAKDDPMEYMKILRLFSPDEKAAFDSPAKRNGLPILRLIELLHDVEEQEMVDSDRLDIKGRLKWTNENWVLIPGLRRRGQFCAVKFEPLTDEERMNDKKDGKTGRIKIFHNNLAFEPNECLQYGFDEWGNLKPPIRFERLGGADPTQFATEGEVEEGSKNAYHTMNMPNDLFDRNAGEVVTNVLLSEYYYRCETPDESVEDLIKEIIFFGKAVMVEGNAPGFFNALMKEKLGYYLFVRDKDGLVQLWTRDMGLYNEPDKKYASIKTISNADVKITLEEFISLYANYFRQPIVGVKDLGATMKSSIVLSQAINLDTSNTKKSDAFMSFGYTLKALMSYIDILSDTTQEDYEEALPFLLKLISRKAV